MESAVASFADLLGAGNQDHPVLDLCLLATRENLAVLRSQLDLFLIHHLPTEAARMGPRDEILLAVQEAASNVVRHAYRDQDAPGRIMLRVAVVGDLLRVAVVDEGSGYNPDRVLSPDFDNPMDGGYGLHLIRATMSRLIYVSRDDANALIMEKSLLPRSDEVPS